MKDRKIVYQKNKNKGFTLVELVVVLVIMGILLGLSVMGMMAWQDWSEFNKQNEYAQTLFVAAQNQLQEYSSNGVLQNFALDLKDDEDIYLRQLDLSTLTDGDGNSYDVGEVWYESVGKIEPVKYRGYLVYASCKEGDYSDYLQGNLDSDTGAEIVFRLLENYVYDSSILNKAISVEFTPSDGQVFAVCYSDRNSSFFYGSESLNETRKSVSINRREESYRRELMIGYYGVDTLAKSIASQSARPVLTRVKLLNEETLNLSFRVSKYPEALQRMTYTMDVYDKDTKNIILTVTVDGSQVHNFDRRSTVSCPVTRYNYDGDNNQTVTTLENYDIICYIDADQAMHFVLDAVDLKANSGRFVNDLSSGLGRSGATTEAAFPMADTFSFHRFGLDADNVYCMIKGSGAEYRTTAEKKSNAESAYFATTKLTGSAGSLKYNNEIENARHLYNVRFMEDLTWTDVSSYSAKIPSGTFEVEYHVNENLNWNEFLQTNSVYYSGEEALAAPLLAVSTIPGSVPGHMLRYATEADFPSVGQLRHGDSFVGTTGILKNSVATLTGFDVSQNANTLFMVYENQNIIMGGSADRPVGLFVRNYGSMDKLALDEMKATGTDKVGAFCGTNAGNLTNLEVKNTNYASVISGESNVGGIMGYLETVNDSSLNADGEATPLDLKSMTNRAKISGNRYVGGIVGQIYLPAGAGATPHVTISRCSNYGALDPVATAGSSNEAISPRYIGGITGFCDNEYSNAAGEHDPELLVVEQCTSSPEYSDEDLRAMLEKSVENAAAKLDNKLQGVYVGGIAGYNYYGTVRNCDTKAEKGKKGFVFGYQYVGGIVGFNQGPASGIRGGFNTVSGVNQANVVGFQYVGGITGCNADVKGLDEENIVIPKTDRNPEVKIENWVNQGVIFATDSYAGGITGYNAGWIYNCDSQVDSGSSADFTQTTYSGDYVGGIAGYNNGIIGNTMRDENNQYAINDSRTEKARKISAVCYIIGKHYVGGIVGYNDVDAIVEDYQIAGGNILGDPAESFYVGGYAGLNASMHLLVDDSGATPHNIVSNPNRVTGKYFVGGSIGANMINTRKDGDKAAYDNSGSGVGGEASPEKTIYAIFKTDNFLCTVNATEFTGGFIGYNLWFDESVEAVKNDPDYSRGITYVVQKHIMDAFIESDKTGTKAEQLSKKIDILEGVTGSDATVGVKINPSKNTLFISGANQSQTENTLGRIQADIYAGGVVGYNDDATKLHLYNVVNTTPIVANEKIERDKEQDGRNTDYADRDFVYEYSYVGGMLGRVSKSTIVEKCKNAVSGTVKGNGTYVGGIAEVNAGHIKECEAAVFGSSVMEYVGPICGLNATGATVEDCILDDKTITGRNVVAGMVAENFGTISGATVNKARLNVSGHTYEVPGEDTEIDGVCGVIAAYNAGTIELSDDLTTITINSKGNYVGAVCGINKGSVTNGKAADKVALKVSGNILGRKSVGGVIGLNDSDEKETKLSYYENKSIVTALLGDAGGIIGTNASSNKITYCVNRGVVSATQAGNAGGITAENFSEISNCVDYSAVTAPNGIAAGIVAINKNRALIKDCTVQSESDALILMFTSLNVTGGVCGENAGDINQVTVKNIQVSNLALSDVSDIGIVAGRNMATGTIELGAGKRIENSITKTYKNNSNIGGVCGVNYGKISGAALANHLPTTVVNCEVGFVENTANVANMGGVAGKNYGEIKQISVIGQVVGNLGSETMGCGGIVGYSGLQNAAQTVYDTNSVSVTADCVIKDCTFDGTVHAFGAGAGYARIGGIAGINSYCSKVESCAIGVCGEAQGDSAKTEIIAGHIELPDVMNDMKYGYQSVKTCADIASYAYLGGMVGENYGAVLSCDNHSVSTDEVNIESFISYAGGIAGVCYEGSSVNGTEEKHTSTGENWRVYARACGNETGTGGIVGNYFSGSDMAYLDNYAEVSNLYPSGSSVAGVIGRLDQAKNPHLVAEHLVNYGDILSFNRAAGLMAMLKGKGVELRDSINYGTITSAQKDKNASGIIEEINNATSDVLMTGVKNHGNIYSADNGGGSYGFATIFSAQQGARANLTDCVNTGVIAKIKEDGTYYSLESKMGFFMGQGTVYYDNCRNYGHAVGDGVDGYSKLPYSFGNVNGVYNSLDHSDTAMSTAKRMAPFGNTDAGSDSYYVAKNVSSAEEKDVFFNMKPYKVMYDAGNSSYVCDYYVAPDVYKRFRCETGTAGGTATIDIDIAGADKAEIDSFVFYLVSDGANTTANNYNYKVSGLSQTGEVLQSISGTKNGVINTLESGRVEIKMSSLAANIAQLSGIRLQVTINSTTLKNVNFRGFSWIAKGETTERTCESFSGYLQDKYHMDFNMSMAEVMNNSGKVVAWNQAFLNDLVDSNYLYVQVSNANEYWEQITFDVNYQNSSAKGMDAFCFYPFTKNGTTTGAAANYAYYAIFTDADGKEASVGTKAAPLTAVGTADTAPVIVSVPDGLSKKIKTVDFYMKCTNNSNKLYLRGFKWIPAGESKPIMMPTNTIHYLAAATSKSNALYTVQDGTEYVMYPAYLNDPEAAIAAKDQLIVMKKNNPLADTYYTDNSVYDPAYDTGEATPDKNSRIAIYKELDEQYEKFINAGYVGISKLGAPNGLAVTTTNTSGRYKFSWNAVNGAYSFYVYYTLEDASGAEKYSMLTDKEPIEVSSAVRYQMFEVQELASHWNNEWGNATIKFYVKAVSGYHTAHKGEADADKYDSAWVNKTATMGKTLPQPFIHIEPIPGNKAVAVLENAEDYIGFEDVCTITLESEKSCLDGQTKITIDPALGYSAPFTITTTTNAATDSRRLMYANPKTEYASDYLPSVATMTYGTMMNSPEYKNTTEQIGTTFQKFFNETFSALTYKIKLNANNKDFIVGADIVAYDEALGVEVAYAHGEQRAAGRPSAKDYEIELSDFAEKVIGKDFQVRSYLLQGQNGIVYYSRYVQQGIPAEELADHAALEAIQDDKYFTADGSRITQSICDESGKLRPGYVIYYNQDETYDILYCSGIDFDESDTASNYQVKRSVYTYMGDDVVDSQGYHYYENTYEVKNTWVNDKDCKLQPKPIIVEECIFGNDQGIDTYTFRWDETVDSNSTLYKNAKYDIELVGVSVDGDEVTLETASGITARSYTFKDNEQNWNYTQLILKVVREGKTDTYNYLPTASTYTCHIKLKLDTIAMPQASLQMVNGLFNKDDLLYDVAWDAIEDSYELADLGGYLVAVKLVKPADESRVAPNQYYFVPYSAASKWIDVEAFVADLDTNAVYSVLNDATCSAGVYATVLDFSDFNGKDEVEISVRALAIKDSMNYTHGQEGDAFPIIIPERLAGPSMDGMALEDAIYAYGSDVVVTAAMLNEGGIPLIMTSDSADKGSYELAIAMFDDEHKQLQDADDAAKEGGVAPVAKPRDGELATTEYWNSQATMMIHGKENPVKMTGDTLAEGKYSFNVNEGKLTDFAGMWVKVAARAGASSSKISSMWSDEDSEEKNTVNYFWFRIPKVGLDDIVLAEGSISRYYDPENDIWSLEQKHLELTVTNPTLIFEQVEYADDYTIAIEDLDGTNRAYYLKSLDEGGFQILSGEDETEIGILSEGESVEIPYSIEANIAEFGDLGEVVLSYNAFFTMDDEGRIILVLPDIIEAGDISEITEADYPVTAKVSIQAIVEESRSDSYQNSNVKEWIPE